MPFLPGPGADRSIVQFLILSGSNFLGSILGFLLVIVIIRASGASTLGQFSFGMTFVAYAAVASSLGTEYQAIRLAAEPSVALRTLVPSVILLRLSLALPAYAGTVLLAAQWTILAPYREVLTVLGLTLIVNAFNIIWLPQALHRAWIVSVGTLMPPLLTILFVFGVAGCGLGVGGYAAGKLAADTIVAVLLVWLSRRHLRDLAWWPGGRAIRGLARASAPVGGSQMFRGLALSSDLIIVGGFMSTVAVGHYSAAFRIFSLLLSIGTMYHIVIIPIFSQHKESPLLGRELSVSLRRTLAGCVLAALPICGLATFILSLGFGSDFTEATHALQLLTVAAAANLLARPYRQVLLTLGRQNTDFWLNAVACGLHIALKIFLGALFGLTGVAAGTATGEAALLLLTRRAALRSLAV